jgi:hypothetical protein
MLAILMVISPGNLINDTIIMTNITAATAEAQDFDIRLRQRKNDIIHTKTNAKKGPRDPVSIIAIIIGKIIAKLNNRNNKEVLDIIAKTKAIIAAAPTCIAVANGFVSKNPARLLSSRSTAYCGAINVPVAKTIPTNIIIHIIIFKSFTPCAKNTGARNAMRSNVANLELFIQP